MIADLDEKQAERVADDAKVLGSKVLVVKMDVTKLDEVEAMVKKTMDEFGTVDVLVNDVGWDDLQLFIETTPDFWDKVIAINYKSVLNTTKAVIPHMIEQRKGSIVNIGSDAGRVGEFKEAVYGGTKGAVIAFTKAVARETGRYGVRMNVVCPGMTLPENAEQETGEDSMWRIADSFFTPEYLEKAAKKYALRKLGKPQDVSNAVIFLASDAAGHITGQTLSVSGGYSMM